MRGDGSVAATPHWQKRFQPEHCAFRMPVRYRVFRHCLCFPGYRKLWGKTPLHRSNNQAYGHQQGQIEAVQRDGGTFLKCGFSIIFLKTTKCQFTAIACALAILLLVFMILADYNSVIDGIHQTQAYGHALSDWIGTELVRIFSL